MTSTVPDLDRIIPRSEGLHSISHLYCEIATNYPDLSAEAMRDAFLWSIEELMRRRRLKFLGEDAFYEGVEWTPLSMPEAIFTLFGWKREPAEPDGQIMFGDVPLKPTDIVVNGLLQPNDPSPEGVAGLIRSKWPQEIQPAFDRREPGFDPFWFEKWRFEWYDENGKPVVF